jgi:sec-independent protein translocase protein TatA
MPTSFVLGFREGPELIVLLIVILVLFGGAKLPQLARSLGSAQREFKKGLAEGDEPKKDSSDSSDSSAS